jgi:cation-transporting ATPase E
MSVKEIVNLDLKPTSEHNDHISSMLYALKDNNQTFNAIKNYLGENCIYKSKTILPFNSKRKLSAVTFENGETYAFGAPEFILSKDSFASIKQTVDNYASRGYRVLLLATSKNEIANDDIPIDFTPLAYILIVDNVREDAITTIKWFNENNVAIKVISGDNPITVAEVSQRVGIPNADKFISLEGLSDQEVFDCANDYTVFGRVSPEQKAILVKALRSAGHVTAMTGDGVNDILALKRADCSIAMASGSAAARNVSHIVLLDSDFNRLPDVVAEGRRVINNIQRTSSLFLVKTTFTILFFLIAH